MTLERRQIPIGNGATVSAVVAHPEPRATSPTAVILAHGAGNDMRGPFLSAVHEGLAARGYVSVKFNFPYTEAGRRAPDRAPVLEDCYRHVVAGVRADPHLAPRRLVIGGKSMGGRMASHLAAQGEAVAGLILLGYPLHPPGKVEQLRVAHLPAIRVPMLFVAGTRDPLCRLDLLQRTVANLCAPVVLHVIDGGDHSFAVPKAMRRPARDVWEEIIRVTVEWLAKLT
ncbi:MAG TPA: alpha/beta family hydrolase [Candidatus Margulisiibacteriota bacterium]|nr:alpha/beta family hydrolase [Candidatus Margulisiibacteriota bacterium]